MGVYVLLEIRVVIDGKIKILSFFLIGYEVMFLKEEIMFRRK